MTSSRAISDAAGPRSNALPSIQPSGGAGFFRRCDGLEPARSPRRFRADARGVGRRSRAERSIAASWPVERPRQCRKSCRPAGEPDELCSRRRGGDHRDGLAALWGVIDARAGQLSTTDSLERGSLDYYATFRSAMAQHRAALVAEGKTGAAVVGKERRPIGALVRSRSACRGDPVKLCEPDPHLPPDGCLA